MFFKKKPDKPDIADQEIKAADFTEINNRLRKIENKQKEMGLQLEEISGFLQDGDDGERKLIGALIAAADNIETFYRFAAESANTPLLSQAEMMWKSAKNAARAAGLEIIDDIDVAFDFQRHTAESAGFAENVPNGHVLKILKCGYAYRNIVVRRAAVVINKTEGN